jgi:hypothetical protein
MYVRNAVDEFKIHWVHPYPAVLLFVANILMPAHLSNTPIVCTVGLDLRCHHCAAPKIGVIQSHPDHVTKL